jgi:hypothetical protein
MTIPDYVDTEIERMCKYLFVPDDNIVKIKEEVKSGDTDIYGVISHYTPYSREDIKSLLLGLVYGRLIYNIIPIDTSDTTANRIISNMQDALDYVTLRNSGD